MSHKSSGGKAGAGGPELVALGESGAFGTTGMGGVHRRGSQAGSRDLKARWWGQAPRVTPHTHKASPSL